MYQIKEKKTKKVNDIISAFVLQMIIRKNQSKCKNNSTYIKAGEGQSLSGTNIHNLHF